MERKKLLTDIMIENNLISTSRYVETNGAMLFELAIQQELEGVVGKKRIAYIGLGNRQKSGRK